ncbi:putative 1-phosphatidylinositol 3-phosphate 5-kinase [Pseudolycoriella hygida]|uniref:1-phosphatidylinositol-3-phosphate 5-kinase n=1 Tax=Pseudolycoriella hygida TaxID=35572 RepID=A0A9Q0N0V4_9DIPT|nr:putative 1-phosphatidylinositol 3-phosphate 5-kinase [Pseudolycoriella hygida]
MNRNLHSPTKLTEFARDFDAEPETFLTKFVNKITNAYNSGYNTINVVPPQNVVNLSGSSSSIPYLSHSQSDQCVKLGQQSPSVECVNSTEINEATGCEQQSSTPTPTTSESVSIDESGEKNDEFPPDVPLERTPSSVLQRISNLMILKNNNLTSYKNTELQKFWMPDSKSKECYECSQKFSTFRRKHHCRLCGQIFCSKCCNQVVPGKIINCSGDLKVCTYCAKIVLDYLKSSEINLDLKLDLQALQEDLSSKFSHQISNDSQDSTTSQRHRKISIGYQEERLVSNLKSCLSNADRKNILQQSNSLKSLFEEMSKALSYQNRGSDLVTFLIANQKSSNKVQAVAILNAMLEAGFLLRVSQVVSSEDDALSFDENAFYKCLPMDEGMRSSGSFQLDLDLEASSVHLSRPNPESMSWVEDTLPTQDNFGFSTTKDFGDEGSLLSTTGSKSLMEAFCNHEELLLSQLLNNENLDQSWAKTLVPLCARIANSIRPDLCGMVHADDSKNHMDIRDFVNFKKVPGGSRNESRIVGGAVFTKNVVHRDMATTIDHPKVLLLQCAIVYQRNEGKFVTIENTLLQERESLRNVTARILSLKPDVVLVHKNVAGIAQDMLRSHGITLVLDVKMSVLERLSRCLNCDIVESIDSNVGRPKLGTCDRFHIQSFNDNHGTPKTLMFFEIISSQRASCCLLRGGTNSELIKVKKVALFLLFARFNWRLELSFLLDEFARPPSPKLSIFDSKDHSPSKYSRSSCDENMSLEPNADAIPTTKELPALHPKSFKSGQKSEEKFVMKENVQDFSDPLRATDLSPSVFDHETSVEFAVQLPYDNRFKIALSSTVLSISPFVSFPLPFLETEPGRKCNLRTYFPHELFYSKQWSDCCEKSAPIEQKPLQDVKLNPVHEFLTHKITSSADSKEIQSLWASYRARGGRYPKTFTMSQLTKRPASPQNIPQKYDEDLHTKDALDLNNHQRLSLLFCSFYCNPKATSSFCAQPSLLRMIFYGASDITLGKFLEHYCFRKTYMCPSCNLPMLDHVRRFVHSMGCVQVKLTEDLAAQNSEQILMMSWCSICQVITQSVPMSKDTRYLSLAKYLELRFHGHAYKRRIVDITDNRQNTSEALLEDSEKDKAKCTHSLHKDHVQYFSYNGIVASFMYSPIEVWEISLPSLILTLNKSKPIENAAAIAEEIKSFAFQGYEVYMKIFDKLAVLSSDGEFPMLSNLKKQLNRDQSLFREKVGVVQNLLTESTPDICDINDAMLTIKRILAETIDHWMTKLHEAAAQSRTSKPEAQPVVDSGMNCTECTEDLRPDSDVETVTDPAEENRRNSKQDIFDMKEKSGSGDSSPNKQGIESPPPKDANDKKSVKTLLRELLPVDKSLYTLTSPLPANEHHTLPIGQFPVLVHDQDHSSVIAYALVSNDYKRFLDGQNCGYSSDTNSNNSPNVKRKSQDGSIDSDEKESDKKIKCEHIEISFHDASTQFTCKIYFARNFDTMRVNFTRTAKQERRTSSRDSESVDEKRKENEHLERKSSCNSLAPNQSSGRCYSDSKDPIIQQEIDETRSTFARSLCTSVRWEARGGKSGSKFCKTLDDRFVLKEMSKMDVTIFENFAPNYFSYVNQCLQKGQPTLLAKIFGVFRVTIKKKDSVQEKSLLVMENLFYECDIANKFDLKGSDRNRLVDPTNQNGEIVLLDENLIQMSWSKPLYILSHSNTILREAILRDASFLEKSDVMDYSLLVGLNPEKKLLVLGIIDYIRTYTFDKKIESLVKQTGFLGGQGKLPTVISPTLYKKRFSEAMERYFLSVPDRWEGLAKK